MKNRCNLNASPSKLPPKQTQINENMENSLSTIKQHLSPRLPPIIKNTEQFEELNFVFELKATNTKLGFSLAFIKPQPMLSAQNGVIAKITNLTTGSLADKAGLRNEDVILEINHVKITNNYGSLMISETIRNFKKKLNLKIRRKMHLMRGLGLGLFTNMTVGYVSKVIRSVFRKVIEFYILILIRLEERPVLKFRA